MGRIAHIPNTAGDTDSLCERRWRARFTRLVRYTGRQWVQLAELQMDKVALQGWIRVDGNSQDSTEGGRGANNATLLDEVDSRWELGITGTADVSKGPLLKYHEWGYRNGPIY